MSWVSSALLRRPSAACARSPSHWKTSPATSPTRRPPRSSASTPASSISFRRPALTKQLAGSVTANSRSTNTVQGDVQSASVATYMAINGDGFFCGAEARHLHRQPAGVRRRRPLHPPRRLPARQERLPRQRRRLLSEGVPVDPTTGNPSAVRRRFCNSRTTSCRRRQPPRSSYRANLASYPLTTHARHVGAGIGTAAAGIVQHRP